MAAAFPEPGGEARKWRFLAVIGEYEWPGACALQLRPEARKFRRGLAVQRVGKPCAKVKVAGAAAEYKALGSVPSTEKRKTSS